MNGVTQRSIDAADDGLRLDRWFRQHYPDIAFGHLQKLLRSGQIRVDGKRVKGDTRVVAGQLVRVPPLTQRQEPARGEGGTAGAQAGHDARAASRGAAAGQRRGAVAGVEDPAAFLRALILYEDADVFVFNKPFGLAVQGGSGLTKHVDGMLPALASPRGDIPRLVHRLDRDTTGVLVVAKTRKAAAALSAGFRSRHTKKIYWALVRGVPRIKQGRISNFLAKGTDARGDQKMAQSRHGAEGAEHALTYYAVVDRVAEKLSWLSLRPVTGRTHQLRVHTADMGHPIIGDPKYFNVENWDLPGGIQNRLHLHARRIVMPLPSGGLLDVSAPLPQHMQQSWNLLGLDATQYDPIEEAPTKF